MGDVFQISACKTPAVASTALLGIEIGELRETENWLPSELNCCAPDVGSELKI